MLPDEADPPLDIVVTTLVAGRDVVADVDGKEVVSVVLCVVVAVVNTVVVV